MTTNVSELQRASLSDPVRVDVSPFKPEYNSSHTGVPGRPSSRAIDAESKTRHLQQIQERQSNKLAEDLATRAGRFGKSILMVIQYDAEVMLRLELVLDRKLNLYSEEIALLKERVHEAERSARTQLKDEARTKADGRKRRHKDKGSRDERDRDGDTVEAGISVAPHKKRRWP
ncbi:hypothetical protein DXG01_012926 [Tephrocybe rancida]|nr:hypothetical protein DXG01_012926 [Tephrocybe rancida]